MEAISDTELMKVAADDIGQEYLAKHLIFKRNSRSNQMGNELCMMKGMFVHKIHSCPVCLIQCVFLWFPFG